ncbi:MAG: aspartate-semialdehyde dehydrogenase [Alphaproteobacteria bacterium]|nr:aspartate-semialdehyde dehydrogenase [Alphaproteobacteria bacterium]
MSRLGVAVLGATGMVGQRMLQLLEDHPWLELKALCASERSVGKVYRDAAPWRLEGDPPESVEDMVVLPCAPEALPDGVSLVLSALPSDVARETEAQMRDAGLAVVSNASAYRTDPACPLIIPEINPEHLSLLDGRAGSGFILTNPNCCAVPLAMALAPLHQDFGVEAVVCSTWQAVSGAGYPGESAWDMVGSVHPHPGNEEEKLAWEPRRILGSPRALASFPVSARCVRVPVADGHLISAQLRLSGDPDPQQVIESLRDFSSRAPELPSSPEPLLHVLQRRDRPSPRFDVWRGEGMAATVGRVERCEVMGVKLYVLAHNTVRGAAGAAIANAELLHALGRVTR